MDGYLGIDVSKDGLDVELVREQRHEAQHFPNNEPGFAKLHRWADAPPGPTGSSCLSGGDRTLQ
jgi:transposase